MRSLHQGFAIACALVVLAFAAPRARGDVPVAGTPADGEFVGVFADPAGTETCASLTAGAATTLYVFGFPGGAVANGFTGVEFRIVVTNPAGYFMSYTPPATALALGEALDLTPNDDAAASGINIAFANCMSAPRVALGTIQVFNVAGGPTELRVERRDPPLNFNFSCPLFNRCDSPAFTKSCMRPCAIDETGAAIAARLRLNVPGCAPETACPAACPGAPCIQLSGSVAPGVCQEAPVTVTATATNCGSTTASVDVFVERVLAGSFAAIPPGQSVTASRSLIRNSCQNGTVAIGAVATSAVCAAPFGAEIARDAICAPTCTNLPPDCSHAFATVSTLWPPDGRMVEIEVQGITDPEGGPLSYDVQLIGTDEPVGGGGSAPCPDAIILSPTRFLLRAERDPLGNGRVYRMSLRAADIAGNECVAVVDVCVPRKPGFSCGVDRLAYFANVCAAPGTGRTRGGVLLARPAGGGLEAYFTNENDSDLQIDIFDVRGRHVVQLARTRFTSGEHVLNWNGRDDSGHEVARGLYVVRLTLPSGVLTAKAALVR